MPQAINASMAQIDARASCQSQSRFIAVHFPRWPLDAARVALWRALHRLRRSSVASAKPPLEQEHGRASGRDLLRELASWPSVVVEGVRPARSDRTARLIECCPRAMELGLSIGMTVAQAEAVCPRERSAVDGSALRLAELAGTGMVDHVLRRFVVASSCAAFALRADESAWSTMLRRLAACLERWVPRIAIAGTGSSNAREQGVEALHASRYSLLGDLAGCSALFRVAHGTEQVLMRRIADSFAARGFETQLATASTIGAAMALACYGRRVHAGPDARFRAVPHGREADALEPLPVEALRLPTNAIQALHAVEVRTIGQLSRLGRGGVAARLAGRIDHEVDREVEVDHASDHGRRRGEPVGGPRVRAASTGRKRGRKAASASTASLFDQPAESGGFANAHDAARNLAGVVRDAGALIGGHDINDPLVRLDQALGDAPESLVPLRMQEPIGFVKTFDGPASRIDALLVACGELVDQLITTLECRREGMRVSRWIFRHAELPADLSTDAVVLHACSAGEHVPGVHRTPARRMISELELRLSAPTMSRAHLWSILRPKLEHLPLDHGVEEITLQLEDAARMRSVQGRLSWRQAAGTPKAPRVRSMEHPLVAKTSDRSARPCAATWSGLDDACSGWIPARRHLSRADGGEPPADDAARLQEWIDLVSARIGRDGIRRVGATGGATGAATRAEVGAIDVPFGRSASCAVHLGRRPSQYFASEETATIVGGESSAELSACIAQRRAWCAGTVCGQRGCMAVVPSLHWRGRLWALSGIDGWERAASRWWESIEVAESSQPEHGCHGERSALDEQVASRAATIARLSGRLHARVQIGTGLWLFARFPDRIAPTRSDAGARIESTIVPDPYESSPRSSPRSSPHSSLHSSLGDQWLDRCERAFDAGLVISILGAWG